MFYGHMQNLKCFYMCQLCGVGKRHTCCTKSPFWARKSACPVALPMSAAMLPFSPQTPQNYFRLPIYTSCQSHLSDSPVTILSVSPSVGKLYNICFRQKLRFGSRLSPRSSGLCIEHQYDILWLLCQYIYIIPQ